MHIFVVVWKKSGTFFNEDLDVNELKRLEMAGADIKNDNTEKYKNFDISKTVTLLKTLSHIKNQMKFHAKIWI